MKAFSCALAMLTALHGSSVMAQPASQRAATYTIARMSPELAGVSPALSPPVELSTPPVEIVTMADRLALPRFNLALAADA